MERDKCKLFYSLSTTKKKADASKKIIEQARSTGPLYVAFSGGKDSTVLLDLAHQVDPDIPAVYMDDQWRLPETDEYLDRTSKRITLHRIKLKIQHTEWFWAHPDATESRASALARIGVSVGLVGLRAEESKGRKKLLTSQKKIRETKRGWTCWPIGNWTTEEIWAWILGRELDFNRAYDKLDALGLPLFRQRVGPLAVERVLKFGQLSVLKMGWPDLFERFAEQYPEARLYV